MYAPPPPPPFFSNQKNKQACSDVRLKSLHTMYSTYPCILPFYAKPIDLGLPPIYMKAINLACAVKSSPKLTVGNPKREKIIPISIQFQFNSTHQ